MPTLVGQAYYLKGDWKGVHALREAADRRRREERRGADQRVAAAAPERLPEDDDENCTNNALQELVVYHPKPEYWQQLLYGMFKTVKSDHNLLQTYRLASEVNVLKRPEDFTDFAQLAIEAGSPGEAEQVIQKGMQQNIFPDTRTKGKAQRLLADAEARGQAGPGDAGQERAGSRAGAAAASRTWASGWRITAISSTTRRSRR